LIKPLATEIPLVSRLIELARKQDRGALAALRTGLGKPAGAAGRMFPIVAPYLTSDEGPATRAAFITAALFAKHPEHALIGSLGASLWKATKRERINPDGKHGEAGVEARFVAALDSDAEDLPRHLEGLVSLCESSGVPIDWHQFYRDLRGLLDQNEGYQIRIRTRWARDFWRGPAHRTESNQTPQQEDTE
jgi:CRISPR type I-E-associated protein CasB/Cse2